MRSFAITIAIGIGIGIGSVTVLAACAHGTGGTPIANRGTTGPTGDVRAVDWQNHTYTLDTYGPIKVTSGRGEFPLVSDDDGNVVDTGEIRGSLAVQPALFADLDGDGVEDAIISSVLGTGGTGQFSQIQIFTTRAGKLVELGGIPGGDRGDGGIRHVAVDGRAEIVERNVLVEGDGLCCPSSSRRERWVWRDGEMVQHGGNAR